MDQNKLLTIFRISFFLWFIFVFVISVYPGNIIGLILKSDPSTYPGSDKLGHFLVYFILSFLACLSFDNNKKLNFIIFFLVFFSLIMELLHLFIPNRYYENVDLLMNFVGVIFGFFIFQVKKI